MKVENCTTPKNTIFKSCARKYLASEVPNFYIFGQEEIYTVTGPFRNHIDWKKVLDYFIKHFENKSRVNIFSLGCSDGSEAISYSIGLADRLIPEQFKKFHIYASDTDSEVIEKASTGKINLVSTDINRIKENLTKPSDENLKKYIKNVGKPIHIDNDAFWGYESIFNPVHAYSLTDKIKKSILFYESDALSEIRKLEDEGNTIINLCHVLGYCSEKYVNDVMHALGEKLKSGSVYVYDKMHDTPEDRKLLSDMGFFFPLGDEHVAEKL